MARILGSASCRGVESVSIGRACRRARNRSLALLAITPRRAATTANNAVSKAERTFEYKGQPLLMLQHLKIGVKDSPNRTLRLHFEWDAEDGVVVIGHCGAHLYVQGH